MFEGTAAIMHSSLSQWAALPANTLVYCAHEYTLANLTFAKAVEPNNPDLEQRWLEDSEKREQSIPTVPSLLATELATNPFLRCQQAPVIAAAQKNSADNCLDPVDVFAVIRAWKDNF